jgi:tRNA dimethylallyltransferase
MIYVITGPTNTGKDRIAIDLAKRIGGEIINADAFHVYKLLKIGTNKPEEDEFEGVNHHLFSYVDIDEEYSIARYQNDARTVIDSLISKNIPIIMLGGSGLYIKAALYDYRFYQEETIDMSKYDHMNNDDLYATLKSFDQHSAQKIHPNNRKRVMRALEIYLSQGIKKSEIPAHKDNLIYPALFFGVDFDRGDLYMRIMGRVHRMIMDGLFDEVKLLTKKYGSNLQALQAIGYKEAIEYLNGAYTEEETIEKIVTNTRHYAKRQMTFVRHQFVVHWIKNVDDILRIAQHESAS